MPDNTQLVTDTAHRHQLPEDAVRTVLHALEAGHGTMAQFSHPAFGGMSQWSSGGMTMVGDMFDGEKKAKLAALCADLSAAIRDRPAAPDQHPSDRPASKGNGRDWWPDDLHSPASTGSQNDMRYAYFPKEHRLAVERQGKVTVYDTGDHAITGAGQQQGGTQTLTFTSQRGSVSLDDLRKVS